MSSHCREFRKFIEKKIKKQRNRRRIKLSDFLHVETFSYCDGTVRLLSVAAGDINWSIDITNSTFFELIETLKLAEQYPERLTNLVNANCEFYIKHHGGKLELTVFLKRNMLQTVHDDFYITKENLEKAIQQSAELKAM